MYISGDRTATKITAFVRRRRDWGELNDYIDSERKESQPESAAGAIFFFSVWSVWSSTDNTFGGLGGVRVLVRWCVHAPCAYVQFLQLKL